MEITSPYGLMPAGSWRCRRCGRGSALMMAGTSDVRDAAGEHARRTGHTVTMLIADITGPPRRSPDDPPQ